MITLANIKRSQLTLTSAFLSILLLTTSCPETAEDLDSPGESPQEESTEVEEVKREANNQEVTLTLERNDSKDEYTSIKDDMGVYAQIVRSGSKVTIKHGNPIPFYEVDLNNNNRIIQALFDVGPVRVRNIASYSGDQLKQITVRNETLQSDSSYSEEPTAELSNINIDKDGGTFVLTNYPPGSVPIIFDVEVTCLSDMNNLRHNIPFSVMQDFSDNFFNLSNQLDYCLSSLEFTNRADNSTFSLNISYKFDSKGRVIEKEIIPSQSPANTVKYTIGYFSD